CILYYVLFGFFFFSSRRRHTRFSRDWSSDVCSSDLIPLDSFDCSQQRDHLVLNVSEERLKKAEGFDEDKWPNYREDPGFFERARSEERRVGKECRSRWPPDH